MAATWRSSIRQLRNKPIVRALRPGLANALVENRSISYGFSAVEFAALMILYGFRPEDFAPGNAQPSISYFGQMLVADHGQFSQIARFDPHHGFCDQIEGFGTDMHTMLVAQALNLALGMIHIERRYARKWIIVPECPNAESTTTEMWSGYLSRQQLKRI